MKFHIKHCYHSIKYSSHLNCASWKIKHTFALWSTHIKFFKCIHISKGWFIITDTYMPAIKWSIFKYCTSFMKICLPHSQLLIEIVTWLIVYHLSHIHISLGVIQKTSHDIVDHYPESALPIIKWLAISSVIILFLSVITFLSSCTYHCIAWPPYIILAKP